MSVREKEAWFRSITRAAFDIRKRCGVPNRETEERIVRVFRAALRPRRKAGRHPAGETANAAALWERGMREYAKWHSRPSLRTYQRLLWQRIYREVFPQFAGMDRLAGQYRTAALRRNVKALLRTQVAANSKARQSL